MKTLKYKGQLIVALHILFWIISFNIFNSFFSRGIESGYSLDGFDLTWWNVFYISNAIILFLLLPFIWFVKGVNRKIKWAVTSVPLIAIGWGIVSVFLNNNQEIVFAVVLGYFLDNFLYVLIFHITIIAAVYLNINKLIKRYFSQGKFGFYLASALGLAVVAGVMNYVLFDLFIDQILPQLFYISWFKVWELILIMTGYIAITTIAFLLWQYWQMLIENREKAQHELSALKAQINPHFLFNNLNTIYSLALKGDVRTKDVILQLSDFLRYVLYDTSSDKIELEKEIEIIKTYVGLQRERINQDITEVILNMEGEFKGAIIAPLLLLPLAENCFKHGVGKSKGIIQIDIQYSGHQLRFSTKNPVARRENVVNPEQGGIGIKNVEKRLNLLYPDKHQLTFTENEELFSVDLKIDLD
jgi:two-component system, LytTR family, sensor kinase